MQWAPGALSLGVKQPGRKADHSPPTSTEVKECVEPYLHSPNTPSWRGASSTKFLRLFLNYLKDMQFIAFRSVLFRLNFSHSRPK
jgi:hypothetical protein